MECSGQCPGAVVGGSAEDAGEPRGVERRGRGSELRVPHVQTVQVRGPGNGGQGTRTVLQHGTDFVLQLHDHRLLERSDGGRVSVHYI